MRKGNTTMTQSVLGWSARFAAVAVICAGLPACGGLGKALGLEKSSPDEFAIVTKAPLVIPPDFALRPPKPGAPRPQEQDPSQAAAQALFNDDATGGTTTATRGEMIFLSKAGALEADSAIRLVLDKEMEKADEKDSSLIERMLFWQDSGEGQGKVLDASVKPEDLKDGEAAKDAEGQKPAEDERTGWF